VEFVPSPGRLVALWRSANFNGCGVTSSGGFAKRAFALCRMVSIVIIEKARVGNLPDTRVQPVAYHFFNTPVTFSLDLARRNLVV
jgi:hypothetical protein